MPAHINHGRLFYGDTALLDIRRSPFLLLPHPFSPSPAVAPSPASSSSLLFFFFFSPDLLLLPLRSAQLDPSSPERSMPLHPSIVRPLSQHRQPSSLNRPMPCAARALRSLRPSSRIGHPRPKIPLRRPLLPCQSSLLHAIAPSACLRASRPCCSTTSSSLPPIVGPMPASRSRRPATMPAPTVLPSALPAGPNLLFFFFFSPDARRCLCSPICQSPTPQPAPPLPLPPNPPHRLLPSVACTRHSPFSVRFVTAILGLDRHRYVTARY